MSKPSNLNSAEEILGLLVIPDKELSPKQDQRTCLIHTLLDLTPW